MCDPLFPLRLRALTVGSLRNKVVHQRAYRPSRSEVEPCLKGEIELLYELERVLPVGEFNDFSAGLI